MYKLVQLEGRKAGRVVKQPIDQVMIENPEKTSGWERLGFIDRRDNAHINFKAGLSEGEKQEAHAAVTKIRAKHNLETKGEYNAAVELPAELTLDTAPTEEGDDE